MGILYLYNRRTSLSFVQNGIVAVALQHLCKNLNNKIYNTGYMGHIFSLNKLCCIEVLDDLCFACSVRSLLKRVGVGNFFSVYLMDMQKQRVHKKVTCNINYKKGLQICEQVFHTGRKGTIYRE